MSDYAMLDESNTQDKPTRLMTPVLRCRSLNRPYEPTLPAIPQIVERKLFSDIKSLEPVFENGDIPWIEHNFKNRKNKGYREVAKLNLYFTRTRRRSSTILKVADLLKILYLTRTRRVAQIRTRLALLEMAHRRRCAGRIGPFNLKEFRALVGTTRITDAEVLAIAKDPRIEVDDFYLRDMLNDLGRDNYDRAVWVPRRILRYLAKKGSRLEIASMMVLLARRMHGRFGRARCSAGLIRRLTGAKETHIRKALLTLQEKKLVMKNRQAERWSVNRFGSLWEFPSDLTVNPEGKTRPAREAPKRRGTYRNLTLGAYLRATLSATQTQKGGDHINTDPTLQLEPQLLMQKVAPIVPRSRSEVAKERYGEAAAAAALELFNGVQGEVYRRCWSNVHDAAAAAEVYSLWGFGVYERLRAEYPPHVKREGFAGYGSDTGADRRSDYGRICSEHGEFRDAGSAARKASTLGYVKALVTGLHRDMSPSGRRRESH